MARSSQYFFFLLILVCLITACKSDPNDSTEIKKEDSSDTNASLSDSAHLILIDKLAGENNYKACLQNINLLLKRDSLNPLYIYLKGEILENLRDTSNAIIHYVKANEKAGFFLEANMRLLNLYAESGDSKAIYLSDTLLGRPETKKNQSDILLMKGIYYQNKNDGKNAEKIFDQIIREDYTFLQAYIEKGLMHYDNKEFKKAMEIFELSTVVKNDFADGYFWMGKTFLQLKKTDNAILNFKKSLALDPSLEEARNELRTLNAIQ